MTTETLYFEDGTEVPAKARMGKSGSTGTIGSTAPCQRCGGAGGWKGWPDFTCFRCGGKDSQRFEFIATKVWTKAGLERLQATRKRAAAKRAEKAAKAEAEFKDWLNENAEALKPLWIYVKAGGTNSFLVDLSNKLQARKRLSEKQLAAIAPAIDRENARKVEREERASKSSHVGEIGDRLDISATVEFVKQCEGHYGASMMIKMVDSEGNVFTTFSTSDWAWEAERGQEVRIRGTVKKHDEFRGVLQTVLTRAKEVA